MNPLYGQSELEDVAYVRENVYASRIGREHLTVEKRLTMDDNRPLMETIDTLPDNTKMIILLAGLVILKNMNNE